MNLTKQHIFKTVLTLLICAVFTLPALYSPCLIKTAQAVTGTESNLYGAGAYAGPEPYGGGSGYSDIISSGDPAIDYTCTTRALLLTALSSASPGDIIFVPAATSITMSSGGVPDEDLTLPAGVILASDRGDAGSTGGRIIGGHLGSSMQYHTFMSCETGSRVTGIRIEGPDAVLWRETNSAVEIWIGLILEGTARVDNCEVYYWPEAGIDSGTGANSTVEWSNIHNCSRMGYGYGVGSYFGNCLVQGNTIDYCRHAVMGGRSYPNKSLYSSYEMIYNIIGPNCTAGSVLDMHGGADGPSMGFDEGPDITVAAGGTVLIHYNTIKSTTIYGFRIRGIPHTSCTVEFNWWYHSNESEAVHQDLDSWGLSPYQHMTVSNNWYGTNVPPDGDPLPPDVPTPAQYVDTMSMTSVSINSATLRGYVSSDNWLGDGVAEEFFVWDTVSHADPGDTDYAACDYPDYWAGTDLITDNTIVSTNTVGFLSGMTYHVRFGVYWDTSLVYQYGDEVSFTTLSDTGCTTYENLTTGDDSVSEEIYTDNLSFMSIVPISTHNVTHIAVKLYRNDYPGTVTVQLVSENIDTAYPDLTDVICQGTFDGSSLTDNTDGEWAVVDMVSTGVVVDTGIYAIVVSNSTDTPDSVYWITTTTDGPGAFYGYSSDNGTTWQYTADNRDGLYELIDCETYYAPLSTDVDALFQVWGEGDAPHGVFIAAVSALFKLATLLGTVIAVVLVLRNKKQDNISMQ